MSFVDQNKLLLKIANSRQKLRVSFPLDPRGDLEIIFKSQKFKLQKAYLRLDSKFFQENCLGTTSHMEIKENYNEEYFSKILSLFYGHAIQMDKTELGSYYPIVKLLQIQCLLILIKKDILLNIQHYDIFTIMKIAQMYSQQQIFQTCHQQLFRQSFEQLKYQQFELLHLDLSLFKLIIKTHNRYKANTGNGLTYIEIDQMLREYCEVNELGEKKYNELKFEILDLTALSSSEYKQIFLDQIIKQTNRSTVNSSIIYGESQSGIKKNVIGECGVESMISNERRLEMQNTFEKKRNEQLKNQNIYLETELQKLRKITTQNQDIHFQMENELNVLREELKKKQALDQEQKRIISKFKQMFAKMQKELEKKTEEIDMLVKKFQEIKNLPRLTTTFIPSSTTIQNNIYVQSQFLPAHFIQEMMASKTIISSLNKNYTPKPYEKQIMMQESLDEEELEQLYLDRIVFDQEPLSIYKKQLPKLCSFLTTEGFSKKFLTLLYRRSRKFPEKGSKIDIRNKNCLLILINTQFSEHIGGYLSVPIPSSKVAYIENKSAFIFTLSKNKKFLVKPTDISQAIFMSQSYLISFANDLMISSDCLTQKSYCFWPNSYSQHNIQKDKGPAWLAGGSQFLIHDIEIYQVNQGDMEMVL